MPRSNNCTSIILYVDPFEFLSVEMKKVVQLHAKTQISSCDFCSEQNPITFYNACPKHKACNKCHDKPGFICNRHTGMCRVKGCKHKVAEFPLQPDERLTESNQIHTELTDAMKNAVQIEHEKFRGKEQELSVAKTAATAEKARADQAALDLEAARVELEAAQAAAAAAEAAAAAAAATAAAAAQPRGRGTKRTLTDEEKEENRAKRNLAKQRKLDREYKEKVNAENAELVAILVPEMVTIMGQSAFDEWIANEKCKRAAAAAGPSSDDVEMDEDEDEC